MAKIFVIDDDDDAAILRRLIDREKSRTLHGRPYFEDDRPPQSPGCYVAKVPAGGIPKLTNTPALGTGSGSGSATFDSPGHALCDIFEVRYNRTYLQYDLVKIGSDETVINLGPVKLVGGYIPITREKFGVWLCNYRELEIDGKIIDADLNYGSIGTMEIYRGSDREATGETESVAFTRIGASGDVITIGTWVKAKWEQDENDNEGGFVITNSNCGPDTGTGT